MTEKYRILSGNILKIIAAMLMVIDHIGVIFFPSAIWLRIVGRLAFPVFAFLIAEGAKYTKNKPRYFLMMFSLAVVCQVFYYFFDSGSLYMCILVTFSLSILLIYALQFCKKCIFSDKCGILTRILSVLLFLISMGAVYALTQYLHIDYGFFGIMCPVFASLFNFNGIDAPRILEKADCLTVRVLAFSVGLLLLSMASGYIQYYSLLAIPLLLLYSEKRGRLRLKYFFYLFYPLHLVVLEGIYVLLYYIK